MNEFDTQNAELFGIIHQNRQCHPGGERMILMNEGQALDLIRKANRKDKPMDADFSQIPTDSEFATRQQLVSRVGTFLCRTLPAAVLLTGAGEGWMNPYFAGICAVPFMLWAVAGWLNK